MLTIRREARVRDDIEFPATESVQVVGAKFAHCRIVGRTSARNLTVIDSEFDHCSIEWKTPLRNHSWLSVVFTACKFRGKFVGNQFGHKSQSLREGATPGAVNECDFSESHLDGTSFLNCDMKSVTLPTWPFFTFVSPSENSEALLGAVERVPVALRTTIEVSASSSRETAAITWSSTEIIQRAGVTDRELRNLLIALPGVAL
jgi:hypothetical protein